MTISISPARQSDRSLWKSARSSFVPVSASSAYTDLQLPEDDRDCYRLVYSTNIFARLTASEDNPIGFESREYENEIIDMEQYKALIEAIDAKIDYTLNKPNALDN